MLSILIAAFIYIITPGPVFLSIIGLVAERGRIEGFKFVSGAIFGCMLWLTLTSASLIESDRLPDFLFLILAAACGSYLLWMGYKMFQSVKNQKIRIFQNPLRDGFIMGVLNPKSYPVMLAVFATLIVGDSKALGWHDFPAFFLTAVSGFAFGYLFMILMAGIPVIRKFYGDHMIIFSKIFGILYTGFGIKVLYGAFFI